ncbi:hypothetical protein Clacol_007746 [Clathrus columnatus]|uniref:Uncharacterized protein n=1 Tax=Clathrus columnatus TaxID=1419009 RepID=A0AAV5AIA4_9AGAM|nr:hypothetical protein Clacol_007746 [Clathrus columnatus]
MVYFLAYKQPVPPYSRSRYPPHGKKPFQVIEQTDEEQAAEEYEDSRTRAQRFLEESAAPVVVQDMEHFKEIVDEHGSYETFILLVLTRLQPILVYSAHHDPMKFLDGFAYSKSAVGRAREATIWLFISAHAWFTRAAAYTAELSIPLPEDVIHVAELFEKAGIAVENYVEKKEPDALPWYDVGTMILNCAEQAWKVLPSTVSLLNDDKNLKSAQTEDFETFGNIFPRELNLSRENPESILDPPPVSTTEDHQKQSDAPPRTSQPEKK